MTPTRSLTLDIGQLPIPGLLDLSGLHVELDLATTPPTLHARIRRIAGADGQLLDLTLDCPLPLPRLECLDGRVGARLQDGSVLQARVTLRRSREGGSLRIAALQPSTADWGLALDLTDAGHWTARFEGSALDLAALHGHLPARWAQALGARWPSSATGLLDLEAAVEGRGQVVQRLDVAASTRALAFSALDAAEGAGSRVHLLARRQGDTWWFQADGRHGTGVLYLVPGLQVAGSVPGLLLDAERDGVTSLWTRGSWQPIGGRLTLDTLRLAQGDWLSAQMRLELADGRWQSLSLDLPATAFAPLYRGWLQPFLAGSPLDALEGEGRIALHAELDPAVADVRIDVRALTLRDVQTRFALEGLTGRIATGSRRVGEVHSLAFDGLRMHGLPLGPARLGLESRADGLSLRAPVEVPLLDGHFVIEGLSLHGVGAAHVLRGTGDVAQPSADRHSRGRLDDAPASAPELRLSGILTPVTLPALTEALGLPRAAGQISGVLPEVRWSGQGIALDGDLLLRIFDGHIVARGLRVLNPFGTLPELATDLDINGIDLELLTREGHFGRIQGRVGGHVHGLRLQAWQPVAMDLHLATPADHDRPRRISQRAVDSLSALSGGGAGLLSRGLMRFFSEYSYGRLGIGCRLIHGICTVSGVARAADGAVVLVSRGGLLPPWIEVRASSREISWRSLTEIFRRIERGELVVQ